MNRRDPTSDEGRSAQGRSGPEEADVTDRKRRVAEVFGDTLPESTRDDRPEEWGEDRGGDAGDEWLRNQVPPHHG